MIAGLAASTGLVFGCETSAATSTRHRPTPTSAVSRTPVSPPASTAPPSQLHARTLARLPGYGDSMATMPGAVFVTWGVPVRSGVSRFWRVSRYDVALGRVTAVSAPVEGAVGMAVSGGALWLAANARSAGGTTVGSLVKLKPSSLRVIDRIAAPTAVEGIAASPLKLWVGGVSRLLLADPTVDRILRSVPTVGTVGQLAVDPDAGVLYVTTHRRGEETAVALEERDISTGQLITRSTTIENDTAINGLAVVQDNVWVASAGGMLGTAERFTRQGLVRHRAPEGELVGTNGIDVFATPGSLWVGGGAGSVWCADPLTGVSRDTLTEPFNHGSGAVVGLAGRVYRVLGQRFEQMVPGSGCAP